MPEEIRTSPVRLMNVSLRVSDIYFHLAFSPPRPEIKLSALMSLASQSATYASRAAFLS